MLFSVTKSFILDSESYIIEEKYERVFAIFGEYVSFADADIVYSDELPGHIRAFVLPKQDGGYTIVVNLKLNDEARRKAVEHELRHIFARDFDSQLAVVLLEKAALDDGIFTEHNKTPAE